MSSPLPEAAPSSAPSTAPITAPVAAPPSIVSLNWSASSRSCCSAGVSGTSAVLLPIPVVWHALTDTLNAVANATARIDMSLPNIPRSPTSSLRARPTGCCRGKIPAARLHPSDGLSAANSCHGPAASFDFGQQLCPVDLPAAAKLLDMTDEGVDPAGQARDALPFQIALEHLRLGLNDGGRIIRRHRQHDVEIIVHVVVEGLLGGGQHLRPLLVQMGRVSCRARGCLYV